ncbi:DinB family protein [Phytoactinopolyspora alkaliphila]|uniref:DinB family protein n=1 Tax=Phytoactinopolyspora alkaliphila TaxID=1783498 RepID=A0A6N9YFS2_9ACTN|nr:DinB family protein [Phytoactinopolyspora alkaliphila]NED93824.1 DinB family protein [Phytoactinopolyspora alkaliphila]
MSHPVLPVRPDVGYDLDDKSELEAFLDFHRATVHHKVAGLSEDQARRRFVPSLTTAAGIVKHLTCVEHYWFRTVLAGTASLPQPWTREDEDADFVLAPEETVAALLAGYAEECERSRAVVARMELADRAVTARRDGRPTLRWVLTHMIEESCRHNGHLDIIRELIDGSTGE